MPKLIRWTLEENILVGKTAAQAIYHGIKPINAYRMAQEKLPAKRQRDLTSVSTVPPAAQEAMKDHLRRLNHEAKIITGSDDVNNRPPLPNSLEEQVERLTAINQAMISTINHLQVSLGNRISNLEAVVLDLLGELRGAPQQPPPAQEKRQAKIAVIGLLGDQQHIIRRDFPNIKLTFVERQVHPNTNICASHDCVIVTRWAGESVWGKFDKYPNTTFVAGGMTSVKEQIAAAAKNIL